MTTVRIPINEEYVRLSRFDVYNGNSDIEARKSDISSENQDIDGKIKAIKAKADFIGKLLEIHLRLKGKEFSRKDVVTLLNCAPPPRPLATLTDWQEQKSSFPSAERERAFFALTNEPI